MEKNNHKIFCQVYYFKAIYIEIMDTIGRNGNNIANIPKYKIKYYFTLNNYYKPKILFILQVSPNYFNFSSAYCYLLRFLCRGSHFERESCSSFVGKSAW